MHMHFPKASPAGSHDYTAVCPSEVIKLTKKEVLFCPLSDLTGFPLLVIEYSDSPCDLSQEAL